MIEPKKITVNGNDYTVQPMGIMETLEFAHEAMAATEHKRSMGACSKTAIRQCLTPLLKPLKDGIVFTEWFNEHPEDLIPLGSAATNELLRPFLKNQNDTKKTGKN